jgi:hypothetical protein
MRRPRAGSPRYEIFLGQDDQVAGYEIGNGPADLSIVAKHTDHRSQEADASPLEQKDQGDGEEADLECRPVEGPHIQKGVDRARHAVARVGSA